MTQFTTPAMALAALLLCGQAQATTRELAERYLNATMTPQALDAQVEGYTDQYAKGQDKAYRQRVHDYLVKVMGWEALKDEYIALVQETYTNEEINAFLHFMDSQPGKSMKSKNAAFANKIATIAGKRAMQVASARKAADDEGKDEPEASPNDLAIANVEQFQTGETIYFTGEIKNNGKSVARGVSIEANLFQGSKFVDQYSTYVTGGIPPGGVRLFKVSCGCKGAPIATHDSYKLQVIAGY